VTVHYLQIFVHLLAIGQNGFGSGEIGFRLGLLAGSVAEDGQIVECGPVGTICADANAEASFGQR
jgi:hypothetical protein